MQAAPAGGAGASRSGAIATLAEWIAAAERPLIIAATLPGDAVALRWRNWPSAAPFRSSRTIRARCACRRAIRCISASSRARCSTDADLVIVLESDVPWIPHLQHPPAGCRVAHIGEDPFYRALSDAQLPERSRHAGGRRQCAGRRLIAAVEPRLQMAEARIAARRARLTERMRTRRAQLAKDSAPGRDNLAGISVARDRRSGRRGRHHLQRISAARPITARARSPARSSRSAPPAGSAGASARRSAPSLPRPTSLSSRRSATAPTCSPTRWSAIGSPASTSLPILTIIFNNSRYGAVRRATLAMFKDGAAGENDGRKLADLDPAPPYDVLAQRARRLRRARRKTRRSARRTRPRPRCRGRGGRQALLNVITPY